MKQEPELIDLFAMFIVQGLLDYSNEHVAEISYRIAHAMVIERQNWIGKNNDRKTD